MTEYTDNGYLKSYFWIIVVNKLDEQENIIVI